MTMPKVEDSKIGTVIAWLFLLGLFVLCWYWGFEIATGALTDPDTCWLIAVGRWIADHSALPAQDPFSWTLADHTRPYVPYQWLATLIFYGLFRALGAGSLLFLVSCIVLISFFALPSCLSRRSGQALLPQLILSILAISAGSFHFPMRPELFSYLFIALLFIAIFEIVFFTGFRNIAKSFALVFSASLIFFALWANLHSGFVLGLLLDFLVWAFCVLAVILAPGYFSAESVQKKEILASLTALNLGACLGTLLTPFNFKLYSYLPGLFFSPTNRYNQELLPLAPREYLSFDYLPFTVLEIMLVLSVLMVIIGTIVNRKQNQLDPQFRFGLPLFLALLSISLIAFIAGDLCRRMIPFAVLLSIPYFVALGKCGAIKGGWSAAKEVAVANMALIFLEKIDYAFGKLTARPLRFLLLMIFSLYFVCRGAEASAAFIPPAIPQKTFSFLTPFDGVAFLQRQRPAGNMLNDPQFGDVLIFAMNEKAQVFIDTRFDLYGPDICRDYIVMANCLNGYESLLDKYKIDWIFFPQHVAIVDKLTNNPDWKTIYKDQAGVILVRQHAR